jgi:hypothetical protein
MATYRHAIQHLNEAIEKKTEHPNTEKIRLMRIAMFADVDAMEEINLPKRK